jgi:hypothetical protein
LPAGKGPNSASPPPRAAARSLQPRGGVLALALSAVLLVSYLVMAYPERVLQTAFKHAIHGWHTRREVAATAPQPVEVDWRNWGPYLRATRAVSVRRSVA